MGLAPVAVTVEDSGAAHVVLVVGPQPEVRTTVSLGSLDEAAELAALDSILLEFDHFGRLVGLRIESSADSCLAPSMLDAARSASAPAMLENDLRS